MVVPGTDVKTSMMAVELAKQYPGVIFAAVGIHPEEVSSSKNSKYQIPITKQVHILEQIIQEDKKYIVAVGETGMDKYGEAAATIEKQKEWFAAQIKLANEYKLPLIIHTRDSLTETLKIWDENKPIMGGIFHCFSYGEAELAEVVARGAWVGIGGNVTWNKRIQKVVKLIPSERLLIETDSPFMTPLEKKPETNEPANVKIIALMIASIRGVSLEELAEQTTYNARKLFKI